MTAGLNLKVDIIKMTYLGDDAVGGAVVTGTVVTSNLPAALTPRRPSQVMLEQGLETDKIFDFSANVTKNKTVIDIKERYEIQVVSPVGHPLFGFRFRVQGVQFGRRRPKFSTMHLTLSRIEGSRKNTLQ